MAQSVQQTESRKNASYSAASFMSVLDSHDPRMRQIVYELQTVDTELKMLQGKLLAGVAILGAAFLGALLAAPFTAGWSFVIFLLAGIVLLFFILEQKKRENQSSERVGGLIEEFRTIVGSLNGDLEDVKTSCGELRRRSVGAKALEFIRLEMDILELLAVSEKLRTPTTLDRITAVARDYSSTLMAFIKMKTKLEILIDSDASNVTYHKNDLNDSFMN
ncbi:hypothetical protein JOB18_019832 [Solea senegalensis]|uniref:Uncharacterized protein n=1 Tax=Solea senegalensis TaxID=28829 RepID=A0AAV6R057_SOLSE|nr:hypothetical protein JOB18_019832 [Solea senegalensis]